MTLCSKLYEYKKADNIYNDLRKEKNYTNENSSNKKNSIDFSHINKDFVCWINIKNTNIDYPVVQGDDNSYYLHRDIYGNYLYAGTTFLDYRNNYNDSRTLKNCVSIVRHRLLDTLLNQTVTRVIGHRLPGLTVDRKSVV